MSREMEIAGLSRDDQRVIGHLVLSTGNALKKGLTTYTASVHASADLMEWLTLEGGSVFRDYTAKERRRMATEGRAMPDGSYPIGDCTDAQNAILAIGRAKDPAKTKAFIKRRVRALNCSGSAFDDWK